MTGNLQTLLVHKINKDIKRHPSSRPIALIASAVRQNHITMDESLWLMVFAHEGK